MGHSFSPHTVLVADRQAATRKLVGDVLRNNNFSAIHNAPDGEALLKMTIEHAPKIVVTESRLPKISGLEYTRTIRAGFRSAPRNLSIIVMTNTPTKDFIKIAQTAGVDEILAFPFTQAALMARIEAVLLRPRRFIETANYVGPCRRRRMLDEYGGPLRRTVDIAEEGRTAPWEALANRELMLRLIDKVASENSLLAPGDLRQLKAVLGAVREVHQLAQDVRDALMAAAAQSLIRYLAGLGGSAAFDQEVIDTHVSGMVQLALLSSSEQHQRDEMVAGLVTVVNKRLGAASAR